MAKKTRKGKAATPRKFWRVQGSQTEYVSRDRFVEASTPEEAREKARQGKDVLHEEDGDRDWGKWQSEDFTDLSDIEEVTEAEAKGLSEPDAPSVVDPLWESIAPTLEGTGGPGYLLGHIELLGVKHHVECIRVKVKDGGNPKALAKDDAYNSERINNFLDANDGVPSCVRIPGQRGWWWVLIAPYLN